MNTPCSRCKTTFECKKESIENCNCQQVQLSRNTRDFLQRTTWSCLCNNCLIHFEGKISQCQGLISDSLIKGLHFYEENGLFVFTEVYHIQKGYCCKNNCRHCPYGYQQTH